jgi:hypothetical protein
MLEGSSMNSTSISRAAMAARTFVKRRSYSPGLKGN